MISFLKKLFGKPAFNPNPLNQPTIEIRPGGWIACQDAQPPFNVQVLVRFQSSIVGIGRRTEKVSLEVRQEVWDAVFLQSPTATGTMDRSPGDITHWKPL